MPTIPTGKMELELRRLYVRWLSRLGDNTDMNAAVDRFEKQSIDLIEKMGGQTARLGALADFPAPKRLDLSPHIGTIYSDMKQAAIQAGIQAGLNASDVARHMFRAGMDKSYHRLNRLARTETVSAYWKNAWDSIEDLPELVMVWGAESGPRTCQWCLERDGMVMESSQLRDHPNGRCTPIPTLRSMVEYKGSVDAGGRIYQDPAWTKEPATKSQVELDGYRDDSDLWDTLPSAGGDDKTRLALRRYQSSDFEPMNLYLRKGDNAVVSEWGQKALDRAIPRTEDIRAELNRHMLPTDTIVWRWQGLDGLESLGDLSKASGKVWRSDGFLSTTLDPRTLPDNPPVRIQILAPAGSKGARLDLINDLEREVLFPDKGEFTILNTVKEGDTWVIQMVLTKQA